MITINNKQVNTEAELTNILSTLEAEGTTEIWAIGQSEAKVCILLNEKRAYIMYLSADDEDCFVSFDPNESEDLFEDFMLSNGQLDEYPRNMTISRSYFKDVIYFFYRTKERYDKIEWAVG